MKKTYKTKTNQTTVKPLAKYEHTHSQSINIIQESTETEQKTVPVKANGETTMKVPKNASLLAKCEGFLSILTPENAPENSQVALLIFLLPHENSPSYLLFLSPGIPPDCIS